MESPVARERTDSHDAVLRAQEVELGNAIQVDHVRRACEPEVHHRYEALTAREELTFLAMLGEEREQLVELARGVVLEVRRLHCHLTSARSQACTRVAQSSATSSTETMTA